MSVLSGPRPDITPPQVIAVVAAGIPILAALLSAFGVYDLTLKQQDALNDAITWASVLGAALIGGDAVVRTGRNVRKGNVESALAAGGEGDRLEIVQSDLAPGVVTTPASPAGTTYGTTSTTGFEEPPPPR